jgi:hypothetical protein
MLTNTPQIAKTKAIRTAYLRALKEGDKGRPGAPESGKPGDAKSIGVLDK